MNVPSPRAHLPRLTGLLVLLSLPAAFFPGVVADAAALYPLAEGRHPYLVPAHGWLLYVAVPLVTVSAIVLFLGPGLCLALGLARSATLAGWLLSGFGVSLAIAAGVTTATGLLEGGGPRGRGFGVLGIGILIAAASVAARRVRAVRSMDVPLATPGGTWGLGLSIGAVAGLVILLLPKFFWENFNGDGAHAFLSSRLLLSQGWPFWPSDVGPLAGFPGVTSMLFAWPNAWFLRLFGELEVSVRLPFLLHLVVLAAALGAVAEHARRPLDRPAWTAVWTGLVAYTLAMAFSATYNPYHADVAMPGTQDTLLMVCLVGWVHAWLREEWGWAAGFGLATVTSLPSGPLLMGLWVAAFVVVTRPVPWRQVAAGTSTLVGGVAIAALLPGLVALGGAPPPGDEYGAGSLARYFALLQFTDWRRLGYFAVPAGLFPALILAWWPGQDRVARGLTLVTIGYFGFFFVQAHIALHHFVPAMLLPVIVAARSAPGSGRTRQWYFTAWLVAALAAVTLSLPSSFTPHTTARLVGRQVGQTVGDYARSEAALFRAAVLLTHLVPRDWDGSVPDSSYGGSPISWLHYVRHGPAAGEADILLAPASRPVAAGMVRVSASEDAVLQVRDPGVGAALRSLRPESSAGNRVYAVPRGILWRGRPLPDGPRIYSLESVRRRLAGLLRRPGV